jgi:outer membrane protein assembly factor BamD (BamD/ComL family)
MRHAEIILTAIMRKRCKKPRLKTKRRDFIFSRSGLYKNRKLSRAREYFVLLTENYPGSKFYEQGAVKLADTFFLEGNFERAQQLYENIEKKPSASNYLSLVYLRLSQIAEKQGRWDDKKKYISILKEKYPSSNELIVADMLEEREDFFTIQVGAFSDSRNAVNLKNELDEKYDTYIIEDKSGNYALYKVRVGKFKDRKEAERTGENCQTRYPENLSLKYAPIIFIVGATLRGNGSCYNLAKK